MLLLTCANVSNRLMRFNSPGALQLGVATFLAFATIGSIAIAQDAPFPYVRAKAWHVLPGTHSDESGYFSLSESHDGRIPPLSPRSVRKLDYNKDC
ncbi:MAG: hypothetical protein ACI9MB_002165 [Verrucomicrobiales bacterium]